MSKTMTILASATLLFLLALAGCSEQGPADPGSSDVIVVQDAAELETLLQEMVARTAGDSRSSVDPNQRSFGDIDAAFRKYGLLEGMEKNGTGSLPTALFMAIHANEAINAVQTGGYWEEELTVFMDYVGGDSAGFSVSWLKPHPNGLPNFFECYVFVDRIDPLPEDGVVVLPYTLPISKAAVRQAAALNDPENQIIWYESFKASYMPYRYTYWYNAPDGIRGGQIMKFYLRIDD